MRKPRSALLATALAVAAVLAPATTSHAALLDELTGGTCEGQELSKPFLRFADPADYVLAPDGGFEAGGEDWALRGGAAVVAGNERFFVRDRGDSRSLRLPAGAAAVSPATCVSVVHPTLRFVARNEGRLLSTLRIDVLFADPVSGAQRSLALLPVLGVPGAWAPTLPTPFLTNLASPLHDAFRRVAFRFTAAGGAWSIDDVYVDPYRKG